MFSCRATVSRIGGNLVAGIGGRRRLELEYYNTIQYCHTVQVWQVWRWAELGCEKSSHPNHRIISRSASRRKPLNGKSQARRCAKTCRARAVLCLWCSRTLAFRWRTLGEANNDSCFCESCATSENQRCNKLEIPGTLESSVSTLSGFSIFNNFRRQAWCGTRCWKAHETAFNCCIGKHGRLCTFKLINNRSLKLRRCSSCVRISETWASSHTAKKWWTKRTAEFHIDSSMLRLCFLLLVLLFFLLRKPMRLEGFGMLELSKSCKSFYLTHLRFSPPSRVTPSHTMADTFGTATTGPSEEWQKTQQSFRMSHGSRSVTANFLCRLSTEPSVYIRSWGFIRNGLIG